jgi:hypothetical protein
MNPHAQTTDHLDQDPDPDEHVEGGEHLQPRSVIVSLGSITLDVVRVATAT